MQGPRGGAISRSSDPRFVHLTKICLAFPQVVREVMGDHGAFKVRKKTFAYFLKNHHGDGIVAVACKVLSGGNTALAKTKPARFFIPPYLGPKGWVALRLDIGEVDWDEVARLVGGSYQLIAPKKLAAMVS